MLEEGGRGRGVGGVVGEGGGVEGWGGWQGGSSGGGRGIGVEEEEKVEGEEKWVKSNKRRGGG